MGFRPQRPQAHARCHEALADLGDALDLVGRDRRRTRHEVEEVADGDGRQLLHRLRIALEGLVGFRGHGRLQRVNEFRRPGVCLAGLAVLVESADRQGHHILVPGPLMELHHAVLDAGHADAGNAAGHGGEIFGDEGAREAERLEIGAAAIGGDDGDAHLRHDLQETLVDRIAEIVEALIEGEVAEQAAAAAILDRGLRHIGIDRGGAR